MGQVKDYPAEANPALTDQLILIKDPAGSWAVKTVSVDDLLERSAEYAEMYLHESTDVINILTADEWHLGVGFLEGDNAAGWTFQTSSISTIDSFSDYSGTVAGTIKATTSAAHNLSNGEIVSIVNTTGPNDYNGVYIITVVDADEFYFTNAGWNATTTGTVIRGVNYVAGALAAGKYLLVGSGSIEPAANDQTYDFTVFINATQQDKIEMRMRAKSNTEFNAFALTGFFDITDGDIVNVAVKNVGGNADITAARYANIAFHRVAD